MDIEVSNVLNEGVTLEVFACAPTCPVRVGEAAGDDDDMPIRAFAIDGAAIVADGVSQEGD